MAMASAWRAPDDFGTFKSRAKDLRRLALYNRMAFGQGSELRAARKGTQSLLHKDNGL